MASPGYPAIFLMGPTAVGKSHLAMALADRVPIEIISVDSAQVYRGMAIGTNKPSSFDQKQVPHHLIDIRDPSVAYSAAEFARDALILMNEIKARGRVPVLVGGTLFYFRVLQEGISFLPSADPNVRAQLTEEGNREGWPVLHGRLVKIDPKIAERIHPNDSQRIQRALEIYEISKKTMSSFFEGSHFQENDKKTGINAYNIAHFVKLPADRKALHVQIEQRFHRMLEVGLFHEVETLFNRGDLDLNMPSIRSVGYRQIWEYLMGKYTYEVMIEKSIAATRQLAKRQLTWIRSLSGVIELQNTHLASLETMVDSIFNEEF